jgi:hypothetical protein
MEIIDQLHGPAVFISELRAPRIRWIGVQVDPRAGLDPVAKINNAISAPARNIIVVVQPVALGSILNVLHRFQVE